jgi:predicted GTPase
VAQTQAVRPSRDREETIDTTTAEQAEAPQDRTDLDDVLDEIDEVLKQNDRKEMEKQSFRDKIRSISIIGRPACSDQNPLNACHVVNDSLR